MTDKRSRTDRAKCFEENKRVDEIGELFLDCHICGGRIWPGRGEAWEAEHCIPHANGGRLVLPAHKRCHADKTRVDISEIAKGKRVYARHFGIKRSKGFYRNPNLVRVGFGKYRRSGE